MVNWKLILIVIFSLLPLQDLWAIQASVPKSFSPEFGQFRALAHMKDEQIDLAYVRLKIEKFIDPTVNVMSTMAEIERMADGIKQMSRYSESVEGKLNGLVQYLYLAGEWNNFQPYQYDFDDPLGTTKPENSLLSNYLKTRKGNCVSMPLLAYVLARRLGLDANLVLAPLHLFVRIGSRETYVNFEATAGGLKRNGSYVEELAITEHAIRNGVYLKSLSNKEAVAVLLEGLAQRYSERSLENEDFNRALELTFLMLELHPENITAMLIRANVWHNILMRDLDNYHKMGSPQIPGAQEHFDTLLGHNEKWFIHAESLGWREPPKDYDQKYLDMVNEARKHYE